jgi:hypothetical protein
MLAHEPAYLDGPHSDLVPNLGFSREIVSTALLDERRQTAW